jgi:hypothetical protein
MNARSTGDPLPWKVEATQASVEETMQQTRMIVALFFLVAGMCGAAGAQDSAAIEEYTQLGFSTAEPFRQVSVGFEYISALSWFGDSAPSEAAQRLHLEAIIYILEGYEGVDVRLVDMPREPDVAWSTVLTEVIDGRSRIRRSGLLGAIEDAEAGLAARAAFVRRYAARLAAFYAAEYGWGGGDLTMNARLARIDFYWQQVADIARFALEAALGAQRDSDSAAVRDALLKIAAFAYAAAGEGWDGPWERPWEHPGVIAQNNSVLRAFGYEESTLHAELMQALAAATP